VASRYCPSRFRAACTAQRVKIALSVKACAVRSASASPSSPRWTAATDSSNGRHGGGEILDRAELGAGEILDQPDVLDQTAQPHAGLGLRRRDAGLAREGQRPRRGWRRHVRLGCVVPALGLQHREHLPQRVALVALGVVTRAGPVRRRPPAGGDGPPRGVWATTRLGHAVFTMCQEAFRADGCKGNPRGPSGEIIGRESRTVRSGEVPEHAGERSEHRHIGGYPVAEALHPFSIIAAFHDS
jgi:hypothetical protein